jgi:hypothetical protein
LSLSDSATLDQWIPMLGFGDSLPVRAEATDSNSTAADVGDGKWLRGKLYDP